MQVGSFKPYTFRYDTLGVVNRINSLASFFRSNADQIIFIQHDGTKENVFLPNTEDWQILPEINIHPTDTFISKTANDAFYHTDLHSFLTKNNITELFITGCATDFCVDTTIKSAIARDYQVTVIEDGHTTADRPHITAIQAIQHYNWLWADMTPTVHKIKVRKTADFLKKLDLPIGI